jgi:CysZ protein
MGPKESGEGHELGVGDGLSAFIGGIGFVLGTPSVWPWAAVPMVMMLLIFCGLASLGGWGAWELTQWLVGDPETTWGDVAAWALRVSLWLVNVVLSLLASLALAQPLSGWALEKVAAAQERALTGTAPPEPSILWSALLGLRVGLVTVFVAVVVLGALLVVDLIFPPALVLTIPLKFFVTGWLLAWDFVDYPLGLKGRGLRARMRWVFQHFTAYTAFGLAWSVVLLIPCVALLVLPMGVAGATRLVVEAERADEALPAESPQPPEDRR